VIADITRAAIEAAASELAARRAIDRWLGSASGRRLEVVGGLLVAWDLGWRCGAAETHAELVRALDQSPARETDALAESGADHDREETE
jgi:hypothetical protein